MPAAPETYVIAVAVLTGGLDDSVDIHIHIHTKRRKREKETKRNMMSEMRMKGNEESGCIKRRIE